MIIRTYILSTTYVHAQNMENKMSADERGNQTQLLFSSVGNAASRSVVITVGLGIPLPRVGKKRGLTTVLGGWTKIRGGMPLETKMPTQNIDVTLTRTDPCRRNRTSLETCKSFTPRRKRLQSSKRHRFCKRHYIIGHLVLKNKRFVAVTLA